MEVSITRFRRELFDLVNQAMTGTEIWVAHKGRRFRIAPEQQAGSRLERITPLQILNSELPEKENALQEEMRAAWERDWSEL